MSSELLIWESTVRSSKHSEQISLKFYIKTPLNIRMNLVGKQEEGPKKSASLHRHCQAWHTRTSVDRAEAGVALLTPSCAIYSTTGSYMVLLSLVILCQEYIVNIRSGIREEVGNIYLKCWTPLRLSHRFIKKYLQKTSILFTLLFSKLFSKRNIFFRPPYWSPFPAFI